MKTIAYQMMRRVKFTALLCSVVLAIACSSTSIALKERDGGSVEGVGTLKMSLTKDELISLRLGDQDYIGKWERSHCTGETCQNLENDDVRHNRHGLLGESVLKASDGSILTCEWLSVQGVLKGSCATPAGKVFNIEREKAD